MKQINLTSFDSLNSDFKLSSNSIKGYLKKKETKIFALLSYWGSESLVNIFTFLTLFALSQYALAFVVIALTVYQTYAVFGVISEII